MQVWDRNRHAGACIGGWAVLGIAEQPAAPRVLGDGALFEVGTASRASVTIQRIGRSIDNRPCVLLPHGAFPYACAIIARRPIFTYKALAVAVTGGRSEEHT